MKVGTDGVLLGAWTKLNDAKTVLDIGTGSGLIALMLAQKKDNIHVDAIDIDPDAINQAKENIENSPFAKQISCCNISLQNLECQTSKKYDLIVSNPPFFIQSLKSPDKKRTLARHTDSLYIDELISMAYNLLNNDGRITIIFPHEQCEMLLKLAEINNLFVTTTTHVFPTPASSPKRVLIEFSKSKKCIIENNLIIEKERHIYTEEFTALVKDFYLKM